MVGVALVLVSAYTIPVAVIAAAPVFVTLPDSVAEVTVRFETGVVVVTDGTTFTVTTEEAKLIQPLALIT
jgi:hypothetical protein